jgi:hypothetical protein
MSSPRDPTIRLRQAVQSNNLPLVQRLAAKVPLRNTDSSRLTSLAWAAICVAEEVFEWLLLDAGHDDDELSRDQENSTVLHLLATVPSPLAPPMAVGKRKAAEMQRAAVRMSILYWEACKSLSYYSCCEADAWCSPAADRLVECRWQDGIASCMPEREHGARQGAIAFVTFLPSLTSYIDALRAGSRLLSHGSAGKYPATLVSSSVYRLSFHR